VLRSSKDDGEGGAREEGIIIGIRGSDMSGMVAHWC
jgi:hypothetical protein